jgi:hypothetical protein
MDRRLVAKTYHKQNMTEEQVYQLVINEITILSQKIVHKHTNIAQLQAIYFKISPTNDKPWPVLVFEQSPLGDLYSFATHRTRDRYATHTGKDMKFDERLGLCLNIGKAITDMHINRG